MKRLLPFFLLLTFCFIIQAQRRSSNSTPSPLKDVSLNGLKFRSVGPALTSGRISDIAVHPTQTKTYYVAVSSGGVWKTENSGTTFTPIFDSQGSYSIGCVTLDPTNPNVVWVGTGENNNQRSVAYGDGVYKSDDGGKSWTHMGLKQSEHIGKILVHPKNPDVVYVAAIGPLWSSGGDRGVYKSTDGGKSWNKILTLDAHTGANDLIMDPRNPDVLYAAAFQRRRHVFTYLGGGPGSTIYKSTDGGTTWNKTAKGLPEVDLGRIGLAISPADPNYLYAIVEASQGKGGVFRSLDGAASWTKRGSYVTSGNYYQEIIPDPINPDKLFAMNNWMRYSVDGGKTFKIVGEDFKHIDNHCMWIDPTDTDHLLVGCDGGIYETWDHAATWTYKGNLPVTQFYKVAVDQAEPFYNIYGGTQDNFSIGGPSRTTSGNGMHNFDWFITHGGDGFESQVDPNNPNIVYAQSQYGFLVRYDRQSGEELGIKPQPRKDENSYRFNWDAPLVISDHLDSRIYFAANKVFKSDDRGESWQVISEDLTRQINRNELKVMDRIWGIDAVAKNLSTSPYGTIVALDESPLNENLLIAGTDDGLIQITEDGGTNWRRISSFPGVPDRSYVNMVLASNHDENVLYACFNHHKYGDFKPYVLKSTDKGRSWTNITNDLPKRGSSYAIAEDHQDPKLLFVGTEFGAFVSTTGGTNWTQLKAGLPTIAVRDIAIQARENDLVLGTFGRGFYVLDDYRSLRSLAPDQTAQLFPVRDAYAFEYSYPLGLPGKSFQGDDFYIGENLGAEALFTYYVKDEIKSLEDQRREREKESTNDTYPTYEALVAETTEAEPHLMFIITDAQGQVVRKLKAPAKKGLQRIKWDLRYPSTQPISLSASSFYNPFSSKDEGSLVLPGTYTVALFQSQNGTLSKLADPVNFEVKALNNASLPRDNRDEKVAFQQRVMNLNSHVEGAQQTVSEVKNQLRYLEKAILKSRTDQEELMSKYHGIRSSLRKIELALNGDPVAQRLDIGRPPSISNRVGLVAYESFYSTAGPTKTHLDTYAIAAEEFKPVLKSLRELVLEDLAELQNLLESAGAPYTPGNLPEMSDF